MESVIVGVVGVLQFEVLEYRLKNEYNVEIIRENLPYEHVRWVENDEEDFDIKKLQLTSDTKIVEDLKGNSLLLFTSPWNITYATDQNENLRLRGLFRKRVKCLSRNYSTADKGKTDRGPFHGRPYKVPGRDRRPTHQSIETDWYMLPVFMNLHSKFYLKRADARKTGHRRLCRRSRTRERSSRHKIRSMPRKPHPQDSRLSAVSPSRASNVHANP